VNISRAQIVTETGAATTLLTSSEPTARKSLRPGRKEFIARKIRDAITKPE